MMEAASDQNWLDMADPRIKGFNMDGAPVWLFLGDAMEWISERVFPLADLLVTDPPYLLSQGGQPDPKGHKVPGGKLGKGTYNNDGRIVTCDLGWDDWLPLAFDALAADADAYIMSDDGNLCLMTMAALKAGFRQHNLLVWDKVSKTPNRWYMQQLEFTGYFWKGRGDRSVTDCGASNYIRMPATKYSGHPTEKPLALMEHYIRQSTQPGDLVLDPFMGGGTTAVAALRTGRRFVGIEIEPMWFDKACQWVAQEMAGGQRTLALEQGAA